MTQEKRNPSPVDLKKLFALSGNRCAFPKCTDTIVNGSTLIGEICHIRAANPGGPRYDSEQSAEDRHGFQNLILLCRNHHKVIDDDIESYTVDRLQKMKSTHEDHATTLNESDAKLGMQVLVANTLQANNQSGGIAANIINAASINFHSNSKSDAQDERNIQAIETLWLSISNLKSDFSTIIFVDSIFTKEEFQDHFCGTEHHSMLEILNPFSHLDTLTEIIQKRNLKDAELKRLFVSERLYSIFLVTQVLFLRSAFLIQTSYIKNAYQDWRTDPVLAAQLSLILSDEEIALAKLRQIGGLGTLIELLESSFLSEAKTAK